MAEEISIRKTLRKLREKLEEKREVCENLRKGEFVLVRSIDLANRDRLGICLRIPKVGVVIEPAKTRRDDYGNLVTVLTIVKCADEEYVHYYTDDEIERIEDVLSND
jgi:hypothetical protein